MSRDTALNPAEELVLASRALARACRTLRFRDPVGYVYHTLLYARDPYESYVRKYAASRKTVVFLGMNPGPWGMAQTGVPFGEVETVRGWLGISGRVREPPETHPRVRVTGFDCARREVSGSRLWGLMRERFRTPERFFRTFFVANYCPLLFLDSSGRNITPDKLAAEDRAALERLCDAHLVRLAAALRPRWVIGIGRFAERRLKEVSAARAWSEIRIAALPHPSPASPQANRGWAREAQKILADLGLW